MKISMEGIRSKRMRVCFLTMCLLVVLHGCQETYVIARDQGVVVGRTMEFSIPFKTYVVTEPAGIKFKAHDLPNCKDTMTFGASHSVIKTQGWLGNVFLNSTFGGINSAGLSASLLYYKIFAEYLDSNYITGEECLNSISQNQVPEYILAKYDSVLQLKHDLEHNAFPSVWGLVSLGRIQPLHYSIIDKNGEALVLEYTKGKGRKFFNNTIGVMTNSPPFDWHMNNLRNYPHLTNEDHKPYTYDYRGEKMTASCPGAGIGLLGLPGDYSSPSRFVRAATLLKLIRKPKTTREAIIQTIHLINAADLTKGLVKLDAKYSYPGKDESLDHDHY